LQHQGVKIRAPTGFAAPVHSLDDKWPAGFITNFPHGGLSQLSTPEWIHTLLEKVVKKSDFEKAYI
jgi:hypothetical protein